MALDKKAIEVITRPLSKEDIKTRAGKAGMSFSYVSPDFVIRALNEAFDYQWNTSIVYQAVHDNAAVVGLQLSVPTQDSDRYVSKEQFGSCEITRGLGVGDAFKGAASDALKKCATLLGLALELYEDKEPAEQGGFRAPAGNPTKNSFQGSAPVKNTTPPAPPRFQNPPPPPAVKSAAEVPPPPSRPMSPPPFPPKPPTLSAPAKKQMVNPFSSAGAGEINATQLNSLTNIAARKNLTQSELIALAGLVDGDGRAISSFEELKYDQAIAVIQAAQR